MNQSVILPSSCHILLYSGEQANTSIVNIGRCSDTLCKTTTDNNTSHVRWCCQTLVYQNMEYTCDNSSPRVYNSISTQCGCIPCTVTVSFVGLVLNELKEPLSLVNIIIDNETMIVSDIYGMFGFTVSALQYNITITVLMSSYSPYNAVIPVIPGQINLVLIKLLPIKIALVITDSLPLFVSMMTLRQYNSINEYVSTNAENCNSLISFPIGYFDQISADDLQFQIIPIKLDSNNDLFQIRSNFVTESSPSTRITKRHVSFVNTLLSLVVFGSLRITDQFGQMNIQQSAPLLLPVSIITQFSTSQYTISDVKLFNLFIYNDIEEIYEQYDTLPKIETINDQFVVEYQLYTVITSITYTIARTVIPSCYSVVRVFESGLWQSEIIRPVIIITRQYNNDEVSMFTGQSKQCLPIACIGYLIIQIDDYFNNYQPTQINYSIDETHNSMIYSTQEDCEIYGIQSNDSTGYFTIYQINTIPDIPPIDTLDHFNNIDIETFCYLRVQIFYCDSNTIKATLMNTINDQTIEHSRLLYVTKDIENELGSGNECHNTEYVCLEYICDPVSHVNISVSYCNYDHCNKEDYSYCHPIIIRNDDLLTISSTTPFISFDSTIDKSGVYYSHDSKDIAYYKCELDDFVTSIQYQCQ